MWTSFGGSYATYYSVFTSVLFGVTQEPLYERIKHRMYHSLWDE